MEDQQILSNVRTASQPSALKSLTCVLSEPKQADLS